MITAGVTELLQQSRILPVYKKAFVDWVHCNYDIDWKIIDIIYSQVKCNEVSTVNKSKCA